MSSSWTSELPNLIQTDLNSPQFVGTPDFMSPEAVTGFSWMPGDVESKDGPSDSPGSNHHSADLWARGAVAATLHTGSTPFWSPSPYLTFLRIKRGLLPRNGWAMPDEENWSFCTSPMQVDPKTRLGFDCFQFSSGKSYHQQRIRHLEDAPLLLHFQQPKSWICTLFHRYKILPSEHVLKWYRTMH